MTEKIKGFLMSALMIFIFAAVALAQTEADLKQFFEGKKVEVKLDMPATKDGVNIYPDKYQHLDFGKYSSAIKQYGVGVHEGDRMMITKIRVKDKHIEFQLGGGGYGTAGDETSSSAYVPTISKSPREKDLEKRFKDETDEKRRRRMRDELDRMRRDREAQDSQNRAQAAVAEEIAKARIQDKRLQAGSRFNVNYSRKLTTEDLTPHALMDALAEYVYFPDVDR